MLLTLSAGFAGLISALEPPSLIHCLWHERDLARKTVSLCAFLLLLLPVHNQVSCPLLGSFHLCFQKPTVDPSQRLGRHHGRQQLEQGAASASEHNVPPGWEKVFSKATSAVVSICASVSFPWVPGSSCRVVKEQCGGSWEVPALRPFCWGPAWGSCCACSLWLESVRSGWL